MYLRRVESEKTDKKLPQSVWVVMDATASGKKDRASTYNPIESPRIP